jgi:hypothetical protein
MKSFEVTTSTGKTLHSKIETHKFPELDDIDKQIKEELSKYSLRLKQGATQHEGKVQILLLVAAAIVAVGVVVAIKSVRSGQ